MSMGLQKDRQGDLMVGWAEMPRSPGHVFYDRLQSALIEGGFDGFAEAACRCCYAARTGAPSVPPGRCFRRHLVGCFEGIDSERGLEWRGSDSLSLREFLRLESRDRVPDLAARARERAQAIPASRRWPQPLVADAPTHRHRHRAPGRGGRIWRCFRACCARWSRSGRSDRPHRLGGWQNRRRRVMFRRGVKPELWCLFQRADKGCVTI